MIHNGTAFAGDGRSFPKEPLIVGAGRLWDEGKNLLALAEAGSPESWPIVIAGPSASEADGSARATANRTGVTFTGVLPHDDVLRLLQRAEIFVSPALYEPFGLAVLEAAAAGCALVLSDIPSFRELWDGAALFVAGRDPADLRSAVDELQRNPARRRALQGAAIARARRYTLARMADAYAALYAHLARARPAALPEPRSPAALELAR